MREEDKNNGIIWDDEKLAIEIDNSYQSLNETELKQKIINYYKER